MPLNFKWKILFLHIYVYFWHYSENEALKWKSMYTHRLVAYLQRVHYSNTAIARATNVNTWLYGWQLFPLRSHRVWSFPPALVRTGFGLLHWVGTGFGLLHRVGTGFGLSPALVRTGFGLLHLVGTGFGLSPALCSHRVWSFPSAFTQGLGFSPAFTQGLVGLTQWLAFFAWRQPGVGGRRRLWNTNEVR